MGGYAAQNPNVPQDIVERFTTGVPASMVEGTVPARSHDFVIPSASQILKPEQPPTDRFLGNLINAPATHESGATLGTVRGRETSV
jgi:hypothetical protein